MSSYNKASVKDDEVIIVGNIQNGNIVIPRAKSRKKTKAVLERENQMKLLKQQFPYIDSMKIHEILSKVRFNMRLAQQEAEKMGNPNKSINSSAEQISYSKPLQVTNCDSNSSEAVDDPLATEFQSNINKDLGSITGVRNQQKLRIERNVVKTEEVEEEAVFIKEEPLEDYIESNPLDESGERVLNFFQNGNFEELKFLNNNPDKGHDVAHKICGLRPFVNWSDLEYKLNKSFPFDMVAVAKEMFNVQTKIDQILEKTKKISKDVANVVQNASVFKHQPTQLICLLERIQMNVLNWLMVLHKENVNGIINYPLGSGRMLQVIAFFALLKEKNGNVKGFPHLVIVPSNVLDNWVEAFKQYCPSLNVFVYNGTKEERTAHRLKFYKGKLYVYDVILTTYTVVVHIADEREVFRSMATDYVVFDETDTVKHINIQLYDNLIKTKALRRLLITSGLLHGNPLELMSVLYFIIPSKLLGDCYLPEISLQKALRGHLADGEYTLYEKKVIDEVKEILEPFILQNPHEDKLGDTSLLLYPSAESTVAVKKEKVYLENDGLVDTADYVQLETIEEDKNCSTSQPLITTNQQENSPDKVVTMKEEVTEEDDNKWNSSEQESSTDDSTSDLDYDFESVKRRISPRRKSSASTLSKRKRKS